MTATVHDTLDILQKQQFSDTMNLINEISEKIGHLVHGEFENLVMITGFLLLLELNFIAV